MTKYDYDVICIGSGSASGAAAFVAKKAGFRVAIVEAEKDRLGGHCPNYACVPTKALLNAAKVLKTARHAQDFGIEARQVSFDFKKVALYRDNIVTQLTGMRIERNLHNAGIDLIWGFAKFVSEHELEIAGRKYSAEHIVIGVGSKEFIPPIEGLAETGFWISDQAVRLTELPRSIIIIGAGPVGTEFTQIFSSFGVETTLLQREDQILQREDKEIAQIVQKDLESRGVNIVLNMEIVRVQKHGQEKIVTIKTDGQEQDFRAQEILVAAGRRAALADLNLEAAGLVLNQLGKLDLNEYLQTDKAHIWVAGDAAANWQFTHTAAYEGDLVGRNICHKHDEATNYDVIPRVTFCEPEVASVGMTEGEAQKKGLEVEIARYPMGNLGRALIDLDRRGLVKIIIEKKSRAILGAHIAGNNAGQLIHEIAVAMKGKLSIETVAKTIHAYPSYSEAIGATAEKFLTF
ncbi:MAG: NAD(P)/FAD-dependent oxidoreductase [bacterium]|nr:NAD(P)/FAD-dependent oxidoreductase [bacterium]